jgi:hypothetical protein
MMTGDGLMTVEVTYQQVDRLGAVPQVDEIFPCDEAPSGVLHVVEKISIVRGGRRVGWMIKGRP